MRCTRWARRDSALLLVVTAMAAAIRLPRLGRPSSYIFDETYYVSDAMRYLGRESGGEISWVHPPLGKWAIAAGAAWVEGPVGWRLATAVAGLATVVLTFLLGRMLLGRWGGFVAALFVTVDGLAIVHARVSMLDGFIAPFILGAAVALTPALMDRDRDATLPSSRRLAVAGVCLGAAVAVKWAAAPVLLAAVVVLLARRPSRRELSVVLATLVALPGAVYLGSFARYWSDNGFDVAGFVRMHRSMLEFHQNLTTTHPYGSPASSWLLLRRPVAYFYETDGSTVTEVLALGNPALWWMFLAVSPILVWRWWRTRDAATELVVLALATLYLPWLVTFRQGFLFYLTPLVPFLSLGLASVIVMAWRCRPVLRTLSAIGVLVVVVVGLLYLPLWTGSRMSTERWESLILFDRWI